MEKEPDYRSDFDSGSSSAEGEEDIVDRGIEAYHPMGKEEQVVTIFKGPFDPGGQPEFDGENKFQIGLHAWNVSGGTSLTKAVLRDKEKFRDYWTWPNALRLIKESERVGLEFQLPLERWLGFGGEAGHSEDSLDPLVSACSLAMHTSKMLLLSTANIGAHLHPLHLSRLGANFDHVSEGRWGLNIVAGWSKSEANFFGLGESLDYSLRHELADEFLTLLKHAWAMRAPFEFDGKFFSSKHVLVTGPYPTRQPRPFFLSPAYSDSSIDFVAKQCDVLICRSPAGDLGELNEVALKTKALATEKYNRYIKSISPVYCVAAATDKDAEAEADALAAEIDVKATDHFIRTFSDQPGEFEGALPPLKATGNSKKSLRKVVGEDSYRRAALGLGALQLIGSYDTIAEKLRFLATDCSQDGVAMSFFDPLKGVHLLEDEIFPRLRKMALRR